MKLQISKEREKKGLTQADVARFVGVTSAQINQIENGKRKPSYEVLIKLEDLFKKNHRKLFKAADSDT